jgi:hypothetical protein
MKPQRCLAEPGDVTTAHRLYFGLLGTAFAGLGLASLLAPGALPPLHARCIGAMALAQALPWLLALRERDSASLRIPLAQALATALALVLAPLARGEVPAWPPLLGAALAGAGSALLLWHDRMLQAPAERADPALVAAGTTLALAAAALALAPAWAARLWPWPLPPRAALLYAAAFAGWGTAAAMLARERRRAARRLALLGLLALGSGVAAVSLAHLGVFRSSAGAAAWLGLFGLLAALAAWRLRARHFALHPLQH